MKKILFLLGIVSLLLNACHHETIGYLKSDKASYLPDTMTIRKTPDPVEDAIRIKYQSPWVTTPLQGYLGTEQIIFTVESVESSVGEEAAALFKKELSIRGGGVMEYPLANNAVPGRYVISVRLTNPGYSQVVKNAYTFVVED